MLGFALNDPGWHEEALQTWRDLDRKLEGDVEALRNIAGLSMQMKRPGDALAAFRRRRTLEGDPGVIEEIDAAIREIEASLASTAH